MSHLAHSEFGKLKTVFIKKASAAFINEEHIILTPGAITIDDITKNYKDFKYFGGDMRKLLQLAKEYSCVRNMKETLVFDMVKTVTRDDFIKSLEHFNKKVEEVTYQTMYI